MTGAGESNDQARQDSHTTLENAVEEAIQDLRLGRNADDVAAELQICLDSVAAKEEGVSNSERGHDPEKSIAGLDPEFAVENRVDASLQVVADIHTQWSYVQMGEDGLASMRQKARQLEEFAVDLQAGIDRYENAESTREDSE